MNVGENEPVDPRPDDKAPSQEEAPAGAAPPEAPPPEPRADEEIPQEDPEVVALRESLTAARHDLDQAQARLRAVSKAYTDLQAEMKAFRERMEHRAKQDSELQAFDQVRAFFDPVMNLKRSLQTSSHDLPGLVQGLQMVQTQFMDALHKLGLEEVPGVGAPFDPNVHEALGVQPVSDPAQDGKVLMVHTAGYTVKGRVLQAAQVLIGKYQEASGEA
jgi:molecular chaperone GrpE